MTLDPKNVSSWDTPHTHKGYKCLSASGRIFISKDVVFNELRFPYCDLFSQKPVSSSSLSQYFTLNPGLSPPVTVAHSDPNSTAPSATSAASVSPSASGSAESRSESSVSHSHPTASTSHNAFTSSTSDCDANQHSSAGPVSTVAPTGSSSSNSSSGH